MDQLGEGDPNAGVPTDNDIQSVQSLFDNFRQALTGVVETSLSTLVDDEWVRTTISTALTVKLQSAADQMNIATVDELREQFRRQNKSATVTLNDARRSSAIRNETQKVELKAKMDLTVVELEKQLQAKYATELKESQDETDRLKKSLESSLMQQLASKAALQKARKEADALKTQLSESARSIAKLEENQGAVEELESMKKALLAEVTAVKREMRKQIDSVNSELNQQIDALTGEIKQVSTEIKTETGKVQPARKTGGKGDCKALLLELMAIMWQEINAARQAAKDERARSASYPQEIASLKVKVDSLEENMRLLQEQIVAAERERDHMKQRLEFASTDMAGHMKAEKQRLEGLIVAAREHAAQWEQKVADMKETLEELRKIAQQRERKLILSTYSQLDELTGHLARQKEQQVRDLVNLIALRENQMASGPGWFEGMSGASSLDRGMNTPGSRMHSKDFVSRPLRSQVPMLIGETAPHEPQTGIRYARSPPPRPQSAVHGQLPDHGRESSSLSRGLSRGVVPGLSPRRMSPRSLDTRPIVGQHGDLAMQLMVVPSSLRQTTAGSLTAMSPNVRPATAGSMTARSPSSPRPAMLPLTARSPTIRAATAA